MIPAIAGLGQALTIASTAVSAVGAIQQGRAQQAAMNQQAQAVERQRQQSRQLASIEEWRTRDQFREQTAAQRAQIAARGLDLGSPTAVFLGQSAAEEMAFAGQTIRQNSAAEASELTAQAAALRARGRNAAMRGRFSAAGTVLNAAPDIWPELLT